MKKLIKKIYKKLRDLKSLKEIKIFLKILALRLTKKPKEVIPEDPKTIPIIIISFNQLFYLKQLVERLGKWGYKNIIIIDNNSTYRPLINYLEEIKDNIIIHRMKHNFGHKVFWEQKELFKLYSKSYYVVTDPDILPDDDCPDDFLEYFKKILDSNSQVTKVGFSLKIKDIPESNKLKEKIIQWESKFWEVKDDEGNYIAEIDTTFALYRPKNIEKIELDFFNSIRTKPPYIAKHGGWYIDFNNILPEQENYMRTAGVSSSWRVNKDGINNHPSY